MSLLPLIFTAARLYKNPADVFSSIMKHDGPLGLWKGLVPTLVMQVPSVVVYYVLYDEIKVRGIEQHGGA